MRITKPATGEALAELPDAERDDAWKAVDGAAKAFPAWAATPGLERGKILRRIFELMTEQRDDLARLVTEENGKPFDEARREVAFATGYFSWFAEEARRVYGEIVPPPVSGKRLWVLRQPLGVVGAITPWNFPATMVTRKIAPALAAGCTVGMKLLRVAGQSCICANRLYVQESIAAKFIPMFIERVNALKVAPGFEAGAQIGPLINAEILSKVDGLVQSAVHSGARLDTGGRRLTNGVYSKGLFYAPTVLTQVREEMAVAREEIFGPVAPVMTFNDEAEVIQRSNNTTFGLAAYFYTHDLRRAIRVAEALEYGMVGVNDATGYTHEIPFGGYKESGLGREGGKQGIEEYMEVKSISVGTSP